jgi:hypothetical protein
MAGISPAIFFLIVFVIIIAAAAIKILREYEGHSNSPLGKVNPDVAIETVDIILVRSNPLDVVAILGLTRATYQKMIQNLGWAPGIMPLPSLLQQECFTTTKPSGPGYGGGSHVHKHRDCGDQCEVFEDHEVISKRKMVCDFDEPNWG